MIKASPEFKEKSRKLIFNSDLRNFPVTFELYVRTFGLDLNLDQAMAEIVSIIRTSEDAEVAFTMLNHFLDAMEADL